ncbi:MAG: hypothetical protein ACFFD1_01175 [Candidatus Thorarchaeota archaeon]
MVQKLIFKDKLFIEGEAADSTAVLTIDESNLKATLSYSSTANLVDRRTALRQAQSICKTGFLLSDGKRIGKDCKLEDIESDNIDDRLLQEGHKYK